MYCKYCGKELKEGARFCDRCGQSVRKIKESEQAAKHREIKQLQEERLNRKKRLEEKENRHRELKNKNKKQRRSGVVVFILVVLLLGVLAAIVSYSVVSSTSGTSGTSGKVTATSKPSSGDETEKTPMPTAASTDKYSDITVSGIKVPYPSSFYTNTPSGNDKLNLTDSLGGATMKVGQEVRTGEIADLTKEYISSIGAENNSDMKAKSGSDWYSVTAEVDGKVYHRKCIIRNNLAVYYDFAYDSSSTTEKKYEDYISYIDANFK